ncbi:outer membrane autotransporter barrel domain-containing protein, partial [Bartonella vinsonii subsp. arupensis OK-94-513]
MHKKYLLSYTATAVIMLFNIQFNAYAETLEVPEGKQREVSGETYERIHAKDGGKIIGKHLTIKKSRFTPYDVYAVTAESSNSVIELQDSIINKDPDTDISLGLEAKDGATIKMIGGFITAVSVGASFNNTNSRENILENVVISDSDTDTLQILSGIITKKSTLTLKDVTVMHAFTALKADDHSTITISGGSFDGEPEGIYALNGSTITIDNNAKITSSSGYGLRANSQDSKIIMTGGTVSGEAEILFADNGGHIKATNVTITSTNGVGTGVMADGSGSIIELNNTTIKDVSMGLFTQPNGTIKMTGGSITASITGASFYNSKNAENILENVTISSGKDDDPQLFGVIASYDSILTLKNVKITQENIGASAVNSQINVLGGIFNVKISGASAESGGTIILKDNAQINASDGSGLDASDPQSQITMIGGTVFGKKAAFYTENGGHIDVMNVSATAQIGGLQIMSLFYTDPNDPQKHQSSEINLTHTSLSVENGAGILIGAFADNDIYKNTDLSIGTANLTNSQIHADVLLGNGIYWENKEFWEQVGFKAASNGTFTLNADQSTLEGRATIAKDRNVHFDLKNNTIWTLKNSAKEKDEDGNLLDIAQRSRSDISTLNLDNSSIIFNGPTEDHYHTLHIGSGKPDTKAVYNATGEAKIYFNTEWSDGIASADQKTDRLLIHGDVEGKTSVYVTGRLEDNNDKANTSVAANVRGLSLIQVSGKAQEDSFKLVNGYTTRKGSPDMYTLRAYGPDSSQGKANIAQNLFDEKNEDFWDFRLQPEILETGSGPNANALVPQTAGYIVMPNALFYSGLVDMAKQNALLANMRTSVLGKEEEKNTGFFLYTYGSTGTLSSERGPLKYGYGADLRYAALEAGVTLAAIEGQNSTTHFGLVATYGQLSFTAKNMQDAGKNTLDKWSLTAYGSSQYDNGFYVDTLLSYGILKGDITNAIIGKTAKLKNAKMLNLSTTVGKEFATGTEGLTLEPQAQLAYQHLMFDTITDVNNFTVDMNNP